MTSQLLVSPPVIIILRDSLLEPDDLTILIMSMEMVDISLAESQK